MTSVGSVCTGYGGLDVATAELLGDVRHAWVADPDPAASRVLACRWPDAPNLGDITAVDWTEVEPVDVLIGGTPCQDISVAGQRRGLYRGIRSGIWHAMCDAIEVLRPALVLWENVKGALGARAHSDVESCPGCMGGTGREHPMRALGRVLGDLADIRYDSAWVCVPAAALGACHLRWRVFLAATPDTHRSGLRHEPKSDRWRLDPTLTVPIGQGPDDLRPTANAGSGGRERRPVQQTSARQGGRREDLARSGARFGAVRWGQYEHAIRRHERMIGRPAPHPAIVGQRKQPKLSPWFDEWLMGLPSGWVTDVDGLTVNDMLRLCGNGVVPLQAIAAYHYLLTHLSREEVNS